MSGRYDQLQQHCNQWKSDGDSAYREHRYQDAIHHYSDIIDGLETKVGGSSASAVASLPQSLLDILYLAHSNRCASYLQQKDFVPALVDAQRCVEYQPYWTKGFSRLGMCYHKLNRLSEAIAAYEQVLSLDDKNLDAKVNIEKIKVQLQKEREQQYQSNAQSHSQGSGFNASHQQQQQQQRQQQQRSSSSSTSTSTGTMADRVKLYLQQWIDHIKSYDYAGMIQRTYYKVMSSWLSLSPETRQYIIYGVVGLLLYYFFFHRSSSSSYGGGNRRYYDPDLDNDDYHYRHSSYGYGGGNRGLSWSAWGLIMFAAYKAPPMFPDQLGEYARPFFGMSWTTFMWLLNMFTNNRNMGAFSRGIFGGGHRRRY